MAVTAKFLADFEDFKRGVDQADSKLRGLGEGATQVGTAIDRAVGKAPEDFHRLGEAAGSTKTHLQSLHGSVDQVDRVLNAAGLSLGPLPGALRELSSAAGKTASELGGLATAGLGVAAAVGGWNVGRWFADWAGTDKIIGDATAKLLGWGDVAKEEAAAGADTLARATALAGREITSLGEAVKILGAEQVKQAEQAKKVAEEHKQIAEVATKLFGRDDIARAELWMKALGGVGNVSKLTKESKEQLKKVVDEAIAAYEALGEKAPGALRKVSNATFDLRAEVEALHARPLPAFTGLLENLDRTLDPLPKDLQAIRSELIFTAETIESEMSPAIEELIQKTEDVTRATLSWSEAMELARTGQGTLGGTVGSRGGVPFSNEERTRMEQMFREGRYQGPIKNYTTDAWGKVVGGEIDWDRLNQMHGITPTVKSAASGVSVTNNITQPLGTPSAIAAAVNDAMTQWMRSSGMRLPSGA